MADQLWDSMLDAEMNVRYWGYMCHRYARYDTWSRIFLAIASSSTVASWAFWAQHPTIWKSLSGLSAVVAIALTVIDLPKKVSHMSVLAARWKTYQAEYQLLWGNDRDLDSSQSKSKYTNLKLKEAANTSDEHTLPNDRALLKKCFKEVCAAHGLT